MHRADNNQKGAVYDSGFGFVIAGLKKQTQAEDIS